MFKKSKRGIKKKTIVIPLNAEEFREMVKEILIDMDRINEVTTTFYRKIRT